MRALSRGIVVGIGPGLILLGGAGNAAHPGTMSLARANAGVSMSSAVWPTLQRRPLELGRLYVSGACPAARGWRFRTGPVMLGQVGDTHPTGFSKAGVLHVSGRPAGGDWHYGKVRWRGGQAGPTLVRGGQVNGRNPIHFRMGSAGGSLLRLPQGSGTSLTGVLASGCYAYQIDSEDGSTVMVLKAVVDPIPSLGRSASQDVPATELAPSRFLARVRATPAPCTISGALDHLLQFFQALNGHKTGKVLAALSKTHWQWDDFTRISGGAAYEKFAGSKAPLRKYLLRIFSGNARYTPADVNVSGDQDAGSSGLRSAVGGAEFWISSRFLARGARRYVGSKIPLECTGPSNQWRIFHVLFGLPR